VLFDPAFRVDTAIAASHLAVGLNWADPTRISRGVFLVNHFNFSNIISIPEPKYDYTYPEFGDEYHSRIKSCGFFGSFGVCDSPEQFIFLVGSLLENDQRRFVVSFTHISKYDQPPKGGWRWHKWGTYIGDGTPTCEYLYDESGFENGVYAYHVIQIGGPLIVSDRTKRLRGY